jgi:hypothetical protein
LFSGPATWAVLGEGGRAAAVVAFCAHSVLLVFAAESLGFHNFVFASIADLHCFWHHIAQDIYVIVKGTSCSSGLFIPRFFSSFAAEYWQQTPW